ncbi:MAG: RNA methyltransferase, partial [Lentisphaeraceae bacterium]|nr:RNA methyltransferase [Lentisphaeraceae bacterium]
KKDAFSKDIIAAAKQSGNTYFPKLSSLKKFSQALNDCEFPIVYGAVPADRGEVSSLPEEGDIALWIGPEGGFSDAELQAIKDKGATGVCIGNWVLRVETAVIALLGVLNQ